MDVPARPGDVLSQATRARLFGLLGEARRPMGTEELAQRLDLRPNGVRVHLERLREAGLITRERTRQGRGRPRDMWLISPDARPGGEPPAAYTDLGRWLARVISPGRTSLRRIEATGRMIGRELAPDGACSPEDKMHAVLTSMGFQPCRELDQAGGLTYRLCNCPYRDAVQESPEVVCTLHRGITRGLLDEIAPETKLRGFQARDPYLTGCLIELSGGLATEAVELRESAQA
ncbi:MAG: helix-turn-helix transcriptional regulator [Solirubrobacteraceae bacterium]